MSPYLRTSVTPRGSSVLGLVIVTAVLYFAKEVLIPLALAILLAFLLAPPVRRLERWLWRIPATLIVAAIGFGAIGTVAWIAGNQAVSLAAKLPEYRTNIIKKIRALRDGEGALGKAAEAIKDLQKEASDERPPLAVTTQPATPLQALVEWVEPFAKPVGTALAVAVFTILLLLNRENMRERLIAVMGGGRINLMTRAMGEASYRVSRYLAMQLVVNAMFGIPFGIALYFIGVPNAMLWGLLGTVLRFIPYAGVWMAAALPALLAFAISDDWSMLLWTLGVFFVLELVLVNAVEPYLYGRSAGLSPLAIILAAVFWTWLWGPIGLLLATPLTVCVTVMGRYIPEMGYLNALLGVEPVLAPEERFYQRLVALDHEEASELAEEHAAAHGAAATLDAMVIPALSLAERDRGKGALEPARERFISETARRIVEELPVEHGHVDRRPAPPVRLLIIPAHDEADQVAGAALARLLPPDEFAPAVLPGGTLIGEAAQRLKEEGVRLVCVSGVPPDAALRTAYAVKRLRQQLGDVQIVAGLWTAEADVSRARERLLAAGADAVVNRLEDAVAELRARAGTLHP